MATAAEGVQLMVPDHPMYATTFEHSSPIVQAAYEIANEAHSKDVRERTIGTFPYITHPIIVCKLLQKLGKGDEINLAVGLLHDVLEDNKEYIANPELMRTRLKAAMEVRGVPPEAADDFASEIYGHCRELCNPESMEEGKRVYQTEHIAHLSKRSKLIKMLDQAASVLEDIWFESTRKPEKLEKFAFKGLNLVKAAEAGGEHAHLQAYQFYKVAFRYFGNILSADPADVPAMRAAFDVDQAMEQAAKAVEEESVEELKDRITRGARPSYAQPEEIITIKHPLYEQARARLPMGCASIDVIKTDDGVKVCGYRNVISPQKDEEDQANLANEYLLSSIESFATRQRVTIHGSEVMGSSMVRHFTLKPAMGIDEFLAKAEKATQMTLADIPHEDGSTLGVVDRRMKTAIKDAQRDLETIRQ